MSLSYKKKQSNTSHNKGMAQVNLAVQPLLVYFRPNVVKEIRCSASALSSRKYAPFALFLHTTMRHK